MPPRRPSQVEDGRGPYWYGSQLLKEIVPLAATVGALFDPLNPAQMDQLHNELAAAAGVPAVKLHPLKVDASSAALEAVFAEALRRRCCCGRIR